MPVIVACFAYVLASAAFDSWIALPCDLPARRLAPARCSNDGLETIPLSVNLVKLTVASRDVPVIPVFSGFHIVWKRGGACSRPSLGNTWIVEDEITEFAGRIDCIVGAKRRLQCFTAEYADSVSRGKRRADQFADLGSVG